MAQRKEIKEISTNTVLVIIAVMALIIIAVVSVAIERGRKANNALPKVKTSSTVVSRDLGIDDTAQDVEAKTLDECKTVILATGDFSPNWCDGIAEDDHRLISTYDAIQGEKLEYEKSSLPQVTTTTVAPIVEIEEPMRVERDPLDGIDTVRMLSCVDLWISDGIACEYGTYDQQMLVYSLYEQGVLVVSEVK